MDLLINGTWDYFFPQNSTPFVRGPDTIFFDDMAEIYNVKHRNAKGDGTSDDTQAIANTIALAKNANQGIVYFPPGEYVAEDLEWVTGVTYMGAGIDVTTLQLKGGENASKHLFRAKGAAAIGFSRIEHMTLQGGETRGTAAGFNGIHLRESVGFIADNNGRATISNCKITGFKIGIHGTRDDRHLHIDNCYFRESICGLFTTHHTLFTGQNDFRECTYGIGHGSIVLGGTTGLFDQRLTGLKISANYGIWPITVDSSNTIITGEHDIVGEKLLPMRACDLNNCLFSCGIAALAIGTFTTIRGCQFITTGANVRGCIFIASPQEAGSLSHISITENMFRSVDSNNMVVQANPQTNVFGKTVTAGGDIANITLPSGSPVVITENAASHDMATGDTVRIQNVNGSTELNGNVYTITSTGANTFSLDGTDGDDFTAYAGDSSGTYTRGRDIDGAAIVIDAAQGPPLNININGNMFDWDDVAGANACIRLQDSEDGLINTNPDAAWHLDISHNTWRHKPSSTSDSQFFVFTCPEQKMNLSRFSYNSIEIDSAAGGTSPVIKVHDSSNTFPVEYIGNTFRVNVSGRYAIEAELEDGSVYNNRVFQGAGFNFTGIDAGASITTNPVDGTRDAAGNFYNS